MDNHKNIVFADRKDKPPPPMIPHAAIMLLCGVGIVLMLFLIAGAWYLLGFVHTFIVIVAIVTIGAGSVIIPRWEHHQHDKADRKHIRHLSQIAIENGHSVEYKPDTRELRTISPFTVPGSPITIKDNTFGTEQAQLAPGLPTAPAFSSLVSQIRPGHLFLAQGARSPIWGDITDLLSTLDVGRPGTGKSTLLRMVCGQVLIIGGRPIIMDPHGSILDDLGSEFECAESPGDISQYAHMLDTHLTQRLHDRRYGQVDFKPMLLLADEMPIISEMAPDALPAIRRVVLEGRKVGMYALMTGQGVPADILGGTLVRDAMSSRYVFNTTPAQAKMAGIEIEIAKSMMGILEDAGDARKGKCVLATANRKPEIVAIPDTSVGDIRSLLDRNVSRNFRNEDVSRNISADFRNAAKSDEEPFHSNVSAFRGADPVEHKREVPLEIRNEIIRLHGNGFNRTQIRDAMHFNGEQFKMIKIVLDEYQQAEEA